MTPFRRVASRTASAVLLILAVGPSARAGTYDFSITTAAIAPLGGSVLAPSGNSMIDFFGPLTSPATGDGSGTGTDMIFGRILLADDAISSSYTDNDTVAYTFAVTVKDLASGATHTFDISGSLSGFIRTLDGSTFASQFTDTYSGPLSQTADIGGFIYSISIANDSGYFTAPSPPNAPGATSSTDGTFAFVVDGVAAGAVPEPGSVVLLGTGALILAVWLRRKPVYRVGRRPDHLTE